MLTAAKSFSRVLLDPCFLTQRRLQQVLTAVLVPAASRGGYVWMSVVAIALMKVCSRRGNTWGLM